MDVLYNGIRYGLAKSAPIKNLNTVPLEIISVINNNDTNLSEAVIDIFPNSLQWDWCIV